MDRQPMVQLSSTPFMNIWEGDNGKRKIVLFNTQDRLDDKIDKLTSMMSKLTAPGNNQNRLFKPKIYQGKGRGQTRNYYNQERYQSRYRSDSDDRYNRIPYIGIVQYGQNYRERPQSDQNCRGDFRRGNCRGTQNYRC